MKKILCLGLLGLMVILAGWSCIPGYAEPQTFDLEGMSLEQLKELQAQVNLAMWATDEWQEVLVPRGIYEIGVDIPAGYWTISATKDYDMLTWGGALDEYGTSVAWDKFIGYECIHNSSVPPGQIHWQLTEGTFLEVDGIVTFTPYVGKNLGFK